MKRGRFFGSMIRYGAVAAAVLAIAGCGGGGGGGDGGATIDITADNEDALARAAAVAVQDLSLAGAAGELPLKAKDAPLSLLRRPADVLKRETTQAMIGPITEPCALGGTRSVTHDDRNNDGQVSIGEPLTIQIASCEETAGEVMNGALALTITGVTDNGFTGTATITNLAFSTPGDGRSVTLDGGVTVSYSEHADPSLYREILRLTVRDPLSIHVNAPFDETVTLLGDYVLETTTDWRGFDATVTTTARGGIASEAAGGRVQLSTEQPIVQASMQPHPQQGRVRLLGKTGSVMTLEALPTNQIRIEADYDGDGTVDHSRDQDWSWLF